MSTLHRRRACAWTSILLSLGLALAACSDGGDSGNGGNGEGSKNSASGGQEGTGGNGNPDGNTAKDPLLDKPTVIVGVKKGQPGFSTLSADEYRYAGFEKDLLDGVATNAKFKTDAVNMPSLDREQKLKSRARDLVIATYSIEDSRDKKVDFTIPYMKTDQGILVPKDDTSIKEKKDLEGKLVCTARGSTSDPDTGSDKEARDTIRETLGVRANLGERLKDYKTCVREMKEGNYDAVWTDEIILRGFAQHDDEVKVVDKIKLNSYQYYAIGLPEGYEADCKKLNKALKRWITTHWRTTFDSHFGSVVDKYPGSFEQKYMPDENDISDYERTSCGQRPGD